MKRQAKKKQIPANTLPMSKIRKADDSNDAYQAALRGLNFQHFWQNADDPNEVIFLFSSNLNTAKQFIKKNNSLIRKEIHSFQSRG